MFTVISPNNWGILCQFQSNYNIVANIFQKTVLQIKSKNGKIEYERLMTAANMLNYSVRRKIKGIF